MLRTLSSLQVPRKVIGLQRVLEDVVAKEGDSGWTETSLQVGTVKMSFFSKDTALWLQQQFGDPKHCDGFVLRAEQQYRDGKRVFCGPEVCDAWLEQQATLPAEAVVAALQLHSDKTVVDHKGRAVWPVKAVLLNVPKAQRRAALENIALIPVIDDSMLPPGLSPHQSRIYKLVAYNACIDYILRPLKRTSGTGVMLADPAGVQRLVYPRALSFVADKPEQAMASCSYDSGICNEPCNRCRALQAALADISARFEPRTLQSHTQLVERILQQPTATAALALSKQRSTYPVHIIGLAGFAGQHLPSADPLAIQRYELQHNFELGIYLYMAKGIKAYITSLQQRGLAMKATTQLNTRLRDVPRAPGLRLPSTTKYFPDCAEVQSKEHAAVLMVRQPSTAVQLRCCTVALVELPLMPSPPLACMCHAAGSC